MEAYEEYKKVEQEDSKMNKIMAAEKGTVKKGLKGVDAPIQAQPAELATMLATNVIVQTPPFDVFLLI